MRTIGKIFVICLGMNFPVIAEDRAACDTNLKPQDPSSKYIEALNCLNSLVISLQAEMRSGLADANSKAAASEAAANRVAQYAQDTNAKLDMMFKKATLR